MHKTLKRIHFHNSELYTNPIMKATLREKKKFFFSLKLFYLYMFIREQDKSGEKQLYEHVVLKMLDNKREGNRKKNRIMYVTEKKSRPSRYLKKIHAC